MKSDNELVEKFSLSALVSADKAGLRLDQAAAELFPDFSRSRLQAWIRDGSLKVDNRTAKVKSKLFGGEQLSLEAELEPVDDWSTENIALNVVYKDDDILVINKPVGLVVHPAAGNRSGTLLNGLLYHYPQLKNVPRAGIVHRLDKDTSGLMVVALKLSSHKSLVEQLQARSIHREYQAIVYGQVTAGGVVDEPIGRHPSVRTRQAVVHSDRAKEAVTHYRILKKFPHHTHLQLTLETGRTHQIRVHMSHIGYPLVGDPGYGGRLRLPAGASPELVGILSGFRRQALHAFRLGLVHPLTNEEMSWSAHLAEDMQQLHDALVHEYG